MLTRESYVTKIPGIPDRADALPGMAHFAGGGPDGKTCGDCKHRGVERVSCNDTTYRSPQCALFIKFAKRQGARVKSGYAACKYFEAKPVKHADG